jgi:pimeloyl-ACP methyl ester carboxylesterase
VPLSLLSSKFSEKANQGALPIIMFPGFGSDERYLKALEYYLRNLGYSSEGWGLGTNLAGADIKHTLEDLSPIWEFNYPEGYTSETYKGEGGAPMLCEKAIARVKQRSQELGSPVVIIGCSLSGYTARECARELPQQIAQIITFGAPVIGGPKYSAAAALFKARKYNLDWIEEAIENRNSNPISQPITSIYSNTDGIVASHAALDSLSPKVQNIQINPAHLGMGFNRKIWKIIKPDLSITQGRNKNSLECIQLRRKTRLIASYWQVFQQKVEALQAFLFVRRVMLRSLNIRCIPNH